MCSKQDLDEYQLHNCVEIASALGPQVLPGAYERLIASLSARLHNGAVGICSMGSAEAPLSVQRNMSEMV